MDSGHSGSIQSSSGGDEEYDSRAESISAIFNSSGHVGPISNPQPLHHHNHNHNHNHNHTPSFFDPLSNYINSSFSRSPPPNANSLLNLDMVWSRGLRSEPNCTDIGNLMAPSSSTQPISDAQNSGRLPFPASSSSLPFQPGLENGVRASAPSDQTNVVRPSKKRSRASRRAPTTVISTDTSNFRDMVQQFTGIPAPPFPASPFPRSRLDLFSTASTMRSGHLDQPPPYLLRPFAQKVQPPSFLSSSSFSSSAMVDAIASTTNITSTANRTAITSSITSNSNHLSSDLLNLQNPIHSFQSLLQSPPPPPPKYPLSNVQIFGTKSIPQNDSHLKMGVLEEFGMGHGLVPSDGLSLRSDNNSSNWVGGVGSNDGDQAHLKSFNGNYSNSQRVSGCKINYSASSSDPHPEKGSENVVPSRGEGMVDSWICSSD
ncbi:hypothetical protein HHK36_009466 [Tetracentron sinense]|uniref:VQ domain-containing protein n=1 Tax=Tetracentron sinense TaxID=13715 RepID=A0A834ZBQ9_TETSI|nr:hypothetical protein HHK36_009466 [Tetracentron sinense]